MAKQDNSIPNNEENKNDQHQGGFDFNQIEIPDTFEMMWEQTQKYLNFEIHKITDIPEVYANVTPTTIQKMGYWQADRYYTLHLDKALQALDNPKFESFTDEIEVRGGHLISKDVNGLVGICGSMPVFRFSASEDLDNPVKLMNFKKETEIDPVSWLENTPVIVFQQYDGTIASDYIELDQQAYNCHKDAVVFKGVYKVQQVEDGKYQLLRIFDKYIFNLNNMLNFDPQKTPGIVADVKGKKKSD